MSKGSSASKIEKLPLLTSSLSSTSLHKTHSKLPHRYVSHDKIEKQDKHQMLALIQIKTCLKSFEKQKQPSREKKKKQSEKLQTIGSMALQKNGFKSRPLSRVANDRVKFNEIFINHREQALSLIKQSVAESEKIKPRLQNYTKYQQLDELLKQQSAEKRQKNEWLIDMQNQKQIIQLEQQQNYGLFHNKQNEKQFHFYNQQILIQLSNLENEIIVMEKVKNNQVLSLPLNYKNQKNLNFHQLLLRTKAGAHSQEIQKQAHMTFLLGQLCIQKGKYKKSLKFFNRFLTYAKIMEDRIGMRVGANRVGISHYHCKNYQKSIAFHNQNVKLSENEQCFIGLYNIGICYRKLNNPQKALQYFESALTCYCSQSEKLDLSSSCTAIGQIAVTYQSMELFQQALQKFQQTILTCQKIKNKPLKLTNLLHLLLISSKYKLKSKEQLLKIAELTFQCAQELGNIAILDLSRTNIGILKGLYEVESYFTSNTKHSQIQEVNQ